MNSWCRKIQDGNILLHEDAIHQVFAEDRKSTKGSHDGLDGAMHAFKKIGALHLENL